LNGSNARWGNLVEGNKGYTLAKLALFEELRTNPLVSDHNIIELPASAYFKSCAPLVCYLGGKRD
jgi:hypothetical protein